MEAKVAKLRSTTWKFSSHLAENVVKTRKREEWCFQVIDLISKFVLLRFGGPLLLWV